MVAPEEGLDDTVALAERVTELEIESAYQQRTIAELDQIVREFADRVVRLERELQELRDATQGGSALMIAPDDEPGPPA